MTDSNDKKAFVYVRVSSTGQVEGHGYERQEESVATFAKSNGFQIVEVFRDAHTGTEADRPGFSTMLGAIKANGVRTVLIERLDRLAREIGVQIALLGMLQHAGISLIETATGRDITADMQDDPMAKALVNIQGVFHQAEKELLVRKLRKARDAKRKRTGRCEGVPGYGMDPKRPDEIKIVDQVRRLRRKSPKTGRQRSAAAIALELEKLGLPTRSGRSWSRSSVREILLRM